MAARRVNNGLPVSAEKSIRPTLVVESMAEPESGQALTLSVERRAKCFEGRAFGVLERSSDELLTEC